MNYYADGKPGGPIPLEIDEVGLTLWLWYEHAKWIAAPEKYLDSIWPQISRAADLLVNCRAPSGLQCAENEDDDFDDRTTLHGASQHFDFVAGQRSGLVQRLHLGE